MTVHRVSAIEAHTLLQDQGFTYIDVRTERELDAGVVEGAYHVPFALMTAQGMQDNTDFVPVMQATFARDAKLVIGCETGVRSLRAAQQLIDAGFTNVVDQRAGMSGVRDAFGRTVEPGWIRAGLPIADEVDPARSYGVLSQRKNAT